MSGRGRLPAAARLERDERIVRAFAAGETQKSIGAREGLHETSVLRALRRMGVAPDPTRGGSNPSRPAVAREKSRRSCRVWPDCPADKLDDYRTLKRYMSARDARATLEGAA